MSKNTTKTGISHDASASQVDLLVMRELLEGLKEWDVNNKMKHGKFLIPQRFRKRLQEILET